MDRADSGEGRVCQAHEPRVAGNELHAESGSFRAGPQAIAFNTGRLVISPVLASLLVEPEGDEPSLELGQGRGEGRGGTQVLLAKPLLARDCLGASLRGSERDRC